MFIAISGAYYNKYINGNNDQYFIGHVFKAIFTCIQSFYGTVMCYQSNVVIFHQNKTTSINFCDDALKPKHYISDKIAINTIQYHFFIQKLFRMVHIQLFRLVIMHSHFILKFLKESACHHHLKESLDVFDIL